MATRSSLGDGEWLTPDGPYQDLVKTLLTVDPRLRCRDAKAVAQGTLWPSGKVRVVNLQLQANKAFKQEAEWSDLRKFREHLELTATVPVQKSTVLLVEGLSPELINILGTYFGIHPSFFVEHERVVVFTADPTKCSDFPMLPSSIRWGSGSNGITLKYFEPLEMGQGPPNFRLSCAESGRHVGVFRLRGQISSVGVIRRKCSVWPVSHANGNYTLRTAPYQGGYVDFMRSHDTQAKSIHGPPRVSMLEDLRHYLIEHGSKLPNLDDPKCSAVFVEKIVASQYLQLSSFMSSVLSSQQWDLSRQEDMARFSLGMVEQQWSDIQSWERRLNEYCDDIEELMMRLGISFQEPDPRALQFSTWFQTDTDFQFLRGQLKNLRNRAEQINAATSGLASIAGNRQAHQEQLLSLRETKRTKALTLVGFIFIPLAYAATLFSMNERYMPGAADFWIYFSVSIPLIIAVVSIYLILDNAYGSARFVISLIPMIKRRPDTSSPATGASPLFKGP